MAEDLKSNKKQKVLEEEEEGINEYKRVLSIQSHVVSGYVGNKAATFPLMTLGFDVDPLNTVHFSNHSGFPTFPGERLNGQQLMELFGGLKKNRLANYSHALTGYILIL